MAGGRNRVMEGMRQEIRKLGYSRKDRTRHRGTVSMEDSSNCREWVKTKYNELYLFIKLLSLSPLLCMVSLNINK